jgi:hypothetical protein
VTSLVTWPDPSCPLVLICADRIIRNAVRVLELSIPGPALEQALATEHRYIIGVCSSQMNSLGTADSEEELQSFYRDFLEQYRSSSCHLAFHLQALGKEVAARLMADFRTHVLIEFDAVGHA